MANLISIPYILKILFALFIYVKRGCVIKLDNGDDDYIENLNVEPHTYLFNQTKTL